MDFSMPGFPVLHHLTEFAHTHDHWVGDAIQTSFSVISSLPAFSLSQRQSFFQWVGASHQVAKVLELQLQQVLAMNIQGSFPLGWTGWISLQSKGLSKRVFPSTIVQQHQFFSAQSVQLSSVAQSCPTLCNPMNCSTPGPPVYHQLPEFTQTHAHRVGDATQPSHPLSPPSPPAPNPSKHQGLFQWVNSSHEVAKVLEFQLQHQSVNLS